MARTKQTVRRTSGSKQRKLLVPTPQPKKKKKLDFDAWVKAYISNIPKLDDSLCLQWLECDLDWDGICSGCERRHEYPADWNAERRQQHQAKVDAAMRCGECRLLKEEFSDGKRGDYCACKWCNECGVLIDPDAICDPQGRGPYKCERCEEAAKRCGECGLLKEEFSDGGDYCECEWCEHCGDLMDYDAEFVITGYLNGLPSEGVGPCSCERCEECGQVNCIGRCDECDRCDGCECERCDECGNHPDECECSDEDGLELNNKKNQVSVGIRNHVFGTIFQKFL